MTLSAGSSRSVALLAFAQTAIFAIPLVVLGGAIGWPASLRLPGAEILPLIHANAAAVATGYWAYLVVSVALVPLAFFFRAWLVERGQGGALLDAVTFVGSAAGVLKTLGIVRWLSAMPSLAAAHAATTDAAARQTIETVYLGLNAYGGSIGEILGVQLFSGLWLAAIGVFLMRAGRSIIGGSGALLGLGLVALCLQAAVPAIAILQTGILVAALIWYLALAVILVMKPAH